MRLIIMGQQAFGQSALERILARGRDEVVAVYCAPDREGRPDDPLKTAAIAAGLPVFQPAGFRDDAVLATMRSHNADLMIMAYVTLFVPEAARDIPRLGSICFHPSLLPLHRGPSSINWPIINGAARTGFSWFYPTDGLDEGDILLQWDCAIDPDDTLGDVYFKKIYPAAIESLDEVCDLFRTDQPPRTVQDEAGATYESWCRAADAKIDWRQPVATVYNLIRGTNPQPGAWTTWQGERLQIYDARPSAGEGEPGTVASIAAEAIHVQATGGRIGVQRLRPAGSGKVRAGDWAHMAGLTVGSRFGVDGD